MAQHVCPWYFGYFLVNPFRKLVQDPAKILGPHVKEGMIVLEPGPGMGFFTLELARRVGPRGKVVALDIQPKMLERLKARASQAGLDKRIEARLVTADDPGLEGLMHRADFCLAFAMVHELPDAARFFGDMAVCLRPGGRMLLAEPKGHVSEAAFNEQLKMASHAGLAELERPKIWKSHAALLGKAGV